MCRAELKANLAYCLVCRTDISHDLAVHHAHLVVANVG
jgi:hypothetical protein